MPDTLTVVLDLGKTLTKLSLWAGDGKMIARRTRPNDRVEGQRGALDIAGIDAWLGHVLSDFAGCGPIGAIVPVGHGAAALVVRDGRPVCAPIDYEDPIPAAIRQAYDAERGAFVETGSPALPAGLNLGAQLYYLQSLDPGLLDGDAQILLWPQYWAWRLSGIAACEVTSLGCHTDLWDPCKGRPSLMADRLGWAAHLPPLRHAGDRLGKLTDEWTARCGLPADVSVHCGLHDSNAALLAARGFAEIAGNEATVMSTGTWFVAMRSPADDVVIDLARLDESRDCLVNVDAFGKPIPSARFMGGREIEILTGADTGRIDVASDQPALIAAALAVVARGAMVRPGFAPGFGPFPQSRGHWTDRPDDQAERRAAIALYAALVADVSLDLIGARDHILVEGRFAEARVFVRALATLRPAHAIYVANAHNDVSFGALRLIDPSLRPPGALERVQPFDLSLDGYRAAWANATGRMGQAA